MFGGMRVAVLSGAGISAESGVPTFRDDKNGLWANVRPLRAVQHARLAAQSRAGLGLVSVAPLPGGRGRNPTTGTARSPPGRTTPTSPCHPERRRSARARRQHAGPSPARQPFRILLRHVADRATRPLPEMPEPALEVEPPVCECGGLIRPDIVWFGERCPMTRGRRRSRRPRPPTSWWWSAPRRSSTRRPGCPRVALARGTVVIEVNPEPTPLSRQRHDHASASRRARRCPGCCSGCPRCCKLSQAVATRLSSPGPARPLRPAAAPRPATSPRGARCR